MYICYGIRNGPYSRWPRDVCEEIPYLWYAGGGIAVQEKDDLVLAVPEFDSSKSMPVKITLTRKGIDVPLIELFHNSYLLYGQPELVWSEYAD